MIEHTIQSERRRLGLIALVIAAAWAVPARADESESVLRERVAWQVALDRVGFSPGLIDGKVGPKTALATKEFQRVRGLPMTGQLDKATADALKVDPENVFGRYTVTAADLAEIGPVPASWMAKSRLPRLGHECLETVIAEKFRCSRGLLNALNPGVNINALKPGAKVVVPVVAESPETPKAKQVIISFSEKVIRVVDEQDRLVAMFHCSIAADKAKLPRGPARVAVIVPNPDYMFKPEKWPEVKERVPGPLRIPPGPRNPVGRVWMGLSLDGYGMHGTPNPELIGKTGSHGCIRLANWDAVRLSRMVQVGTPVKFVSQSSLELVQR